MWKRVSLGRISKYAEHADNDLTVDTGWMEIPSSGCNTSGLTVSGSSSMVKGLTLLLGGILVAGASGGWVVFLLEVKLGILLTFLLDDPMSDLLSSS